MKTDIIHSPATKQPSLFSKHPWAFPRQFREAHLNKQIVSCQNVLGKVFQDKYKKVIKALRSVIVENMDIKRKSYNQTKLKSRDQNKLGKKASLKKKKKLELPPISKPTRRSRLTGSLNNGNRTLSTWLIKNFNFFQNFRFGHRNGFFYNFYGSCRSNIFNNGSRLKMLFRSRSRSDSGIGCRRDSDSLGMRFYMGNRGNNLRYGLNQSFN